MMIRTAWLTDLNDITLVEAAAFAGRLRWTDEDLRSEIGQGRVIVCQLDGVARAVGYAAFRVRDGIGSLDSVGVHPHWQSRGVGSELTRRAVHEMRHAECVELDCDASLEGFYARMGFEACGRYTSGIGARQVSRLVMRWVP